MARVAAMMGVLSVGLVVLLAASSVKAQDAGTATADAGVPEAMDAATGTVSVSVDEPDAGEGSTDVEADAAAAEPETDAATAPETPSSPSSSSSSAPSSSSSSSSSSSGRSIPLDWTVTGYARFRLTHIGNLPQVGPDRDRAVDAGFGTMRLRLEPALLYGPSRDLPIAALRFSIDGLDNVVFGDNARIARTPLFAGDPSGTDIEGFDVDTFKLRRVWLELQVPVGQIRIGRMPSEWGLGLLTSPIPFATAGEGPPWGPPTPVRGDGLVTDWGDPQFGTTYDRILFATRPLTIVNTLLRQDSRSTPLVLAIAYDILVEDPLGFARGPSDPSDRSLVPFSYLGDGEDDVQEVVTALIWRQTGSDTNETWRLPRATDELAAGVYFVNRWQDHTESDVYIYDAFWRLRWGLGPGLPSLFTTGEILTIQGSTRGLSIRPGFDEDTGLEPDGTDANIWGGAFRAGVVDARWSAILEAGFASGDGELQDDEFTQRAIHPDYHVGLLMYQVALAARTAIQLGPDLRPLWSRGGVWNSKYFFPQARFRPSPGWEIVGAFLLAWADELNVALYNNRDDGSTSCSVIQGDCFLGWEADLALKVSWGEGDLVRWSTEAGVMHAGDALSGIFSEEWLWTLQSRISVVF
ncbi:MAG: hypothetical protein IT379_05635 [Deltaproteobacteria bacterium]|nr:hypothetical protein [Deltaproteobacteria bacterium]